MIKESSVNIQVVTFFEPRTAGQGISGEIQIMGFQLSEYNLTWIRHHVAADHVKPLIYIF